jgi:hypothetical protein
MAEPRSWIVTDVDRSLWVDTLFLGHEELGVPDCTVSKRVLRGGLRDGVEVIEVNNGHLAFSVLPTRGMGIWKGEYRGVPLGWDAPVKGPVHPKFVDLEARGGLGWLHGFDEWICRCGLDSNGSPGEDVVLDNNGNPVAVRLTLHGRIANLPAHRVEIRSDPEARTVTVSGRVDESALFCPGLGLRTAITTAPLSNRLSIADEVVNLKGTPSELELLYHANFGAPFLEAGARLLAPVAEAAPRDPRAAEGVAGRDTYLGPTAGYVEQVYFYELIGGGDGRSLAALVNAAGDRAAVLRFDVRELPCFSQWKNTVAASDGYVTGLEPGTNYPNLKSIERRRGRVVTLAPGASRRAALDVEVHLGAERVEAVRREVAALQARRQPVVHHEPNPRFS